MTHKPAWFARSLPHDWHGGSRIRVDGDTDFQITAIQGARWIGTILAIAAVAWGLVAIWSCV